MINSILIQPTEHTPKVVALAENIYEGVTVEISGESVPEDSLKFYAPVFQWLSDLDSSIEKDKYSSGKGINLMLNFRMQYFNSSSAKIFIMLMEKCSGLKKKYQEMEVTINWQYDDEDIMEAGEEFKSLVSVPFNIIQNHISIKGSRNSPEVIINPEKNLFEISGRSNMENAIEFYNPVLEWMSLYGNQYFDKGFQFNFKLRYFNTPSSKMLLKVLQKLDEIYSKEKAIKINWYYEEDDEREEVEGIFDNLKIPFSYVKANLSDTK